MSTGCVSTDIGSRVFCAHSTAIGTQDGIPSMSCREEQLSHELVIWPFSSIETWTPRPCEVVIPDASTPSLESMTLASAPIPTPPPMTTARLSNDATSEMISSPCINKSSADRLRIASSLMPSTVSAFVALGKAKPSIFGLAFAIEDASETACSAPLGSTRCA